MVPSRCTHLNYSFNWGEKGDPAHALRLSYIPVLYIPRILNCVQTRTTPARPAPAAVEKRAHTYVQIAVSESQRCPSFQGKKKVQRARETREVGFLDVLTSNSLHTESWLHLSHAIQPLNDGPGIFNKKKKKKKGGKKKKKKEIKLKKKKEIHTRFPSRARTGNCCPSPRMNRGHLSYNCFPSHDKAIKSRQGSDSASTLLASDAQRAGGVWLRT